MSTTTQLMPDVQATISRALAKIGDIATLPEITTKIIEIVENPKSTARDLHDIIKNDPALSTKVLKVVNSAFYGLPGQIASIDRAIVLLGLSAVKNIAIAASIRQFFKGGQITERFSAKDLWRHSVGVAVASKMIAVAQGRNVGSDEVFLAGLIHDLGILVERQAFPEQLAEVVNRCAGGEGTFNELETQVIGADHQTFGAALTTKWKFPRHLRAVVGFHHNYETLTDEYRQMVATIHISDLMCSKQKIGFHLTVGEEEITDQMIDDADITREDLEVIGGQLEEQVTSAEANLTG